MNNLQKFPRTYHADFSLTVASDDKKHKNLDHMEGKCVIETLKMDGENFTGYMDYSHARSLDSNNHPSRNWIKGYWAERQYLVPEGWRFCFENCYAQHSIIYENLDTYAYLINIWDDKNMCLSWDETLEWCTLLDLIHVPILYEGKFNYDTIKNSFLDLDFNTQEGIVVRNTEAFHYDDYKINVMKAVRAEHVQTDEHWMSGEIKPNKLKI